MTSGCSLPGRRAWACVKATADRRRRRGRRSRWSAWVLWGCVATVGGHAGVVGPGCVRAPSPSAPAAAHCPAPSGRRTWATSPAGLEAATRPASPTGTSSSTWSPSSCPPAYRRRRSRFSWLVSAFERTLYTASRIVSYRREAPAVYKGGPKKLRPLRLLRPQTHGHNFLKSAAAAPHTHTHTHSALCPALPRWAGTRKVKPIWILLKQETVSGSGISWAICKTAPCTRQISMPAPHHSDFYRPDALPATNQQHQSTEGVELCC